MKLVLLVSVVLCTTLVHAQPRFDDRGRRIIEPTPIYAGGEFFPKPPPPSSYIHTRSVMQQATKGVVMLSSSCESGEVLLGGGYSWGPSTGIAVVANYPSSEMAWTAEFHVMYEQGQVVGGVLPPFQATLTTLAYCLSAPGVAVQMQTVVQDNAGARSEPVSGRGGLNAASQTWSARCPSGSVLTGGGFAVDGPYSDEHDFDYNTDIFASQPLVGADKVALGWSISMLAFHIGSTRHTRAYARCALTGLNAAPAGEIDANLTVLPYAIGNSVAVSQCGGNNLTTGGGHVHTGDWLVPHWVSVSKVDGFNFQSWRATSFGAYQTPQYDFRPCTPITAQCLSANVIAACFAPPDIDYINVRITSPPGGHAFGLERYGASTTERIAFTAEVYDKNGKVIPNAIVRWTSQPKNLVVPPPPSTPGGPTASTEEFLGFGNRLNTALGAGQSFQDVIIKAYAVVRRPGNAPLIANDYIVLMVGTVP